MGLTWKDIIDGGKYALSSQFSRILNLLILPFTTKYLELVDFGVYGLILATLSGLGAFSTLGLEGVIANNLIKHPFHYKVIWKQLLGFIYVWGLIFAIVLALFLELLLPKEVDYFRFGTILLLILPGLLSGQIQIFGRSYLQYNQRPSEILKISIIAGFTSALVSTVCIIHFELGFVGWVFGIFTNNMVTNILYAYKLFKEIRFMPIFNFKIQTIKKHLKISLPLIPHYYSNYLLNTSDQIVMKFLGVSTASIGIYNNNYLVGSVFQNLGISGSKAIGPKIYQSYKKREFITARKLINQSQTLILFLGVIISIWIDEIGAFLFNEIWSTEYSFLGVVIIMSYSMRPLYTGSSSILFFFEKTKTLLIISLGAGIINVLANIILIPHYGFQAAAFSTFFCMLYVASSGYFLKDFKNINTAPVSIIPWIIIIILSASIVLMIMKLTFYYKVLTSILLLPVYLLLYKKMS